jgi:hypothetical protein
MPKAEIQFRPVRLTGKPALRKKRVRQSSGEMISVYSLDAEGTNLAANLSAVFAKNVAAARRENSTLSLAKKGAKASLKVATKSNKKRPPKG